MFDLKRFGKVMVCLLCCAACLLSGLPAAALSTITVNPSVGTTTESPAVSLDSLKPQNTTHLVSKVHRTASTGGLIIGHLENGTKLDVKGSTKYFYKISCYGTIGYIAKNQVKTNEAGEYYVSAVEGSNESAHLPSYSAQEAMVLRDQLVATAKKYVGVPYVYGGTSPWGFDCSGYLQYVYKKVGININRVVCTQLMNGVIVAKEDLQPGDMVIFSNTVSGVFASHIGMYLGNGQIIHASETRGITIVSFSNPYFAYHYECGIRVVLSDVSVEATLPTVNNITGNVGSGWRNAE